MTSLSHLPMRISRILLVGALVAAPVLHAQTTIGAAMTTSVGPLTRSTAGFQSFGQSFVVPTRTTQLSSFSLGFSNFFNGGALKFDAYILAFDAANRRVTGSVLWNATDLLGSSNDFAFDTRVFNTGNLSLTAGTTYLFLITTSTQGAGVPADASNLVGANDVDGYTGGSFWAAYDGGNAGLLRDAGAFSAVSGVTDASFSAVFRADPTVVPEPATLFLTGVGLMVLWLTARRRGRREA